MEVTLEMYSTLFNEITDIERELEVIIQRLKDVQIKVEEMYISADN